MEAVFLVYEDVGGSSVNFRVTYINDKISRVLGQPG